ncbi:uncharacterized protein LOC129953311 [Eupeodes corollae]|uniref:uncharacterized protein LOC129953311 n=1 Tax=Eupeodes corollae TaxID=290404 RepID=UPI002491F35E|nr:uncharacterized protein LOC129953311 [Eupeodes corollae]
MARYRGASTFFIIASLMLLMDATEPNQCQAQYTTADDIMSLSGENEQPTWDNSINNCVEPLNMCSPGSRSCCTGSTCRCDTWDNNCRCQITDETSVQNPSNKGDIFTNAEKRSCIRRGGACDHRPNECCYSSSCRCNLWGSNCRCQRVGIFQKWG